MTTQERRYVCRLIDHAVERCEEGNLQEQLEVPRWIADLVVQLQAVAGEELVVPPDSIAAHGQLLDLRGRYLPKSWPLETSDRELERRRSSLVPLRSYALGGDQRSPVSLPQFWAGVVNDRSQTW